MEAHEIERMMDAHEKLDEQRFSEASNLMLILRRDLLDENYGILPRLDKKVDIVDAKVQKTNGKVMLHQKILWVLVGGAAALALNGNTNFIHLLTSFL